jgi:hypothetical protein
VEDWDDKSKEDDVFMLNSVIESFYDLIIPEK